MKGIDIAVPAAGWSSWYSTGGIITTNGTELIGMSYNNILAYSNLAI